MRWRGVSGSRTGTALSSARVYGMCRMCEQRLRLAEFDDPAKIHDRNAAADVFDQAQVVGDEQIRQLQPFLQLQHQANDLCLDGDVERRDRFVGNDERRIQRQCARDADSLTLAAAELVGIACQVAGIEADEREQLGDAGRAVPASSQACG